MVWRYLFTAIPEVSQTRHFVAFRLTCEKWRSYTSEMDLLGPPNRLRHTHQKI